MTVNRRPSSQHNIGELYNARTARSYYDASRESQRYNRNPDKELAAPVNADIITLNVRNEKSDNSVANVGDVLWLPALTGIWPDPADYTFPDNPAHNWHPQQTIFDGVEPTDKRLHTHDFAVVQTPMQDGQVASCVYRGVIAADVYVDDNLDWCMRCDADPSQPILYARPEGSARILWKSASPRTGKIHRCIVSLENPVDVKLPGVATEDITPWISASQNFAKMEVYADEQPTGWILDYARWDWLHDEENNQISSGKQMICTYFHHERIWRPTHAQCEDAFPVIGQMTTDPAAPEPTQAVGTTPEFVSAMTLSSSSGGVVADPATASFTLPDTPSAGRNYRVNMNATVEVSQNNREVSFWAYVNGVQGPRISKLAFQNASASQTMVGSPLVAVPAGSGQTLALWISSSPATTVTYNQMTFNIEAI